jgi:hypothetical protein
MSVTGRALSQSVPFVCSTPINFSPAVSRGFFFIGLICAVVTSDHTAGAQMDRSPEAIWAELWKLSAQTMALEIMLVSLIEGLGRASLGSRVFVASVLQDAVNSARMMAERGPTQTEGDVHFTRIIGIIRTTAETLGVADLLPP